MHAMLKCVSRRKVASTVLVLKHFDTLVSISDTCTQSCFQVCESYSEFNATLLFLLKKKKKKRIKWVLFWLQRDVFFKSVSLILTSTRRRFQVSKSYSEFNATSISSLWVLFWLQRDVVFKSVSLILTSTRRRFQVCEPYNYYSKTAVTFSSLWIFLWSDYRLMFSLQTPSTTLTEDIGRWPGKTAPQESGAPTPSPTSAPGPGWVTR